jgi:L-cysteine/cystine lyase
VSAINVDKVRAGIPALEQCIYLNSGTFGPLPSVVADEIRRAYGLVEQWGTFAPRVFRELELEGLENARQKVADLMHADPDEIAFTHNVTDGINIVLHGLDWSAGDEVVISEQEHPAGTTPWLALAQRRGVVLRLLPVYPDADEMTAHLQELVGPRTRLVCLSHVSCLSGARLPVERLCSVARAAGALTLLDGAHAEGQFPVNVPATGADFYAACGHKWLLGPQGTGMLYVRRASLGQLRPAWLGWGVNKPFDRPNMRYELEASAARFEQSTQAWPLYLALGRAIDYLQDIGLDNIQARVRRLVGDFRQALAAIPGLTFHTPAQPHRPSVPMGEQAAGLLTCSIHGQQAEALSQQLWERQRILTNHIGEFNALRFSVAFFNTAQELQTTAETLAQAAHRSK